MLSWIVTSCVLILAVLLIRRVFRGKASARAVYALWLFVALRLLIPGSIAVDAPVPAVATVVDRSPVVQFSDRLDGADSLTLTPEGEVEAHYPSEGTVDGTTEVVAESTTERAFNLMNVLLGLKELAVPLWLTGAAAVALVFALSWMKFSRSVRRSRELIQVPGTPVRVYISDAVDTPCLFGLFLPAVYLPSYVASEGRLMRHALEHELSHYRQRDHIWCVLRCACLALHWYNPLVWLAVKLSKRDCELACDEATVGRLGEAERASYGRSLIRLTCETPRGAVVATAMCARPKELKERITMLTKNKHSIIALALAAVLAVTATACSFVSVDGDTDGVPGTADGSITYRRDDVMTYDFTAPGGSTNIRLSAWFYDGDRWIERPQADLDCTAPEGNLSFSISKTEGTYGYVMELSDSNGVYDSAMSLYSLVGGAETDFTGTHIQSGTMDFSLNETLPLVMLGTSGEGSIDYFYNTDSIEDPEGEYICFTVTFTRADGHIAQSEMDVSSGITVYDYTAPTGARSMRFTVYRYDRDTGTWDSRMVSDLACKTDKGRLVFTSDLTEETFGFGVEYADGTGSSVDGLSFESMVISDGQEFSSWGSTVGLTSAGQAVGLSTEVPLMLFTGMVGGSAYTGTDYFEHPENIEGDDEYICITVAFTSYGSIAPSDGNADGNHIYDFAVPAGASNMLVREYSLEGGAWNEIRRETFDCTEKSGQLAFRLDMENAALGYGVRFDPDEQLDLTSHSVGEYVTMPAGGWLTESFTLYPGAEVPLVMLQPSMSSFYATPDMFSTPDELPESGIVCLTVTFFNEPDMPQPITPPPTQSAELEGFRAAYDSGSSYAEIADAWVNAYAENLVGGLVVSDPASCSIVAIDTCEVLASSLTQPERIIVRMGLDCTPRDENAFALTFGNVVYGVPAADNAGEPCEILLGRTLVLELDNGVANCVAVSSDEPERWGYQTTEHYTDEDYIANMSEAGMSGERIVSLVNYGELDRLSTKSWMVLLEALDSVSIAPEGVHDQLVRDMYAMLAVNGADGAYSAWLGNIYREQREHDPETFNLALSAFDAETQEHITYLADNPV